ncbi:hypothetical protein LCGC14_2350000 [marine sediment metagenome]|uniref:Uncharacterized protein n=1 Tax=marine sediment metagenome TaxID=412755 RepID=A0A0F9EM62_9ZZZZ
MMSEKTRVEITVHLNSQYEGRPDLTSPYVREFLQELCDMGAKQVFGHHMEHSLIRIELETRLDGGPIIISTETTTFGTINGYRHRSISEIVSVMSDSMIRSIGGLVEDDIKKALAELRKPEIVHVPTGVTYEGFPVSLRITGKGDSLTDDITRAEALARRLHDSVAGGFNKSWALTKTAEFAQTLVLASMYVADHTTAHVTGTYCEGFMVCLMTPEGNVRVDRACQQMRETVKVQLHDTSKWGIISG